MENEQYLEKKKEYKDWCRKKKERHEEEEEVKLRGIKRDAKAWKYINRY